MSDDYNTHTFLDENSEATPEAIRALETENYEDVPEDTMFSKFAESSVDDKLLRLFGLAIGNAEAMETLMAQNLSIHEEITSLSRYVKELEQKAADMATPEAMQKMMSNMMGGML
jgi:hypothetical protein